MEALRAEGILTEEGVRNFRVEQGVLECVPCASGQEARQLLFACGGLWEPPSGTVEVFGRQLYRMDGQERAVFRRRNIGVVDAENNLIPGLNLYENVILSSELDGRQPDLAQAEKLAAQAGLAGEWDKKADCLSPGKGQIAAIIRSVLAGSSLILMRIDLETPEEQTRGVMEFLHRIHEQRGLTAVVFSAKNGLEP